MKEMLGGCCVCSDENGWTGNPLVYCDGPGCEVAVHQGLASFLVLYNSYSTFQVVTVSWRCPTASGSVLAVRRALLQGPGFVFVYSKRSGLL